MDGEQTIRDLGLDKVLLPEVKKCILEMQFYFFQIYTKNGHTSAFPYNGVELRAEEGLCVVKDVFHHHRLDTHLHEGRCAAEAG